MAAELQPPELPVARANRTGNSVCATPAAAPTTATTDAPSPTTATATTIPSLLPTYPGHTGQQPTAPKRQRRPSVRLGEIGDQAAAYDSHVRRSRAQPPWTRLPKESQKSIKARSLTNLVNGGSNDNSQDFQETDADAHNGDINVNLEMFGHRKKAKRGTARRVRSNWISSKVNEGGDNNNSTNTNTNDNDNTYSREEGDETFRELEPDSDQSPVHSVENVAAFDWGHRTAGGGVRGRVFTKDVVFDMDNDTRDDHDLGEDRKWEGVRTWLIELGLNRYAPVFEVHEVDDEVLPMLTLEDLKDMGINAVGSRRKLYCAIQKLRKEFSFWEDNEGMPNKFYMGPILVIHAKYSWARPCNECCGSWCLPKRMERVKSLEPYSSALW